MKTFDFPFHTVRDDYPESSASVRFGRGYAFASRPRGPDQIITHLSFPVMFTMVNQTTGLIDRTVAPHYNFEALLAFYEEHRMYEIFKYNHPRKGLTEWRFSKPLQTPDPLGPGFIGGVPDVPGFQAHALAPFQLEIILQP
jgi:hypothetical protein